MNTCSEGYQENGEKSEETQQKPARPRFNLLNSRCFRLALQDVAKDTRKKDNFQKSIKGKDKYSPSNGISKEKKCSDDCNTSEKVVAYSDHIELPLKTVHSLERKNSYVDSPFSSMRSDFVITDESGYNNRYNRRDVPRNVALQKKGYWEHDDRCNSLSRDIGHRYKNAQQSNIVPQQSPPSDHKNKNLNSKLVKNGESNLDRNNNTPINKNDSIPGSSLKHRTGSESLGYLKGSNHEINDGLWDDVKPTNSKISDGLWGDVETPNSKISDGIRGDVETPNSTISDGLCGDVETPNSKINDGLWGDVETPNSKTNDGHCGDVETTDSKINDGLWGDVETTDSKTNDGLWGEIETPNSKTNDGLWSDDNLHSRISECNFKGKSESSIKPRNCTDNNELKKRKESTQVNLPSSFSTLSDNFDQTKNLEQTHVVENTSIIIKNDEKNASGNDYKFSDRIQVQDNRLNLNDCDYFPIIIKSPPESNISNSNITSDPSCIIESGNLNNTNPVRPENLHHAEGSISLSDKRESSDFDETSTDGDQDSIPDPEQIVSITNYLIEIEKERSIDNLDKEANKILHDVNKVLKYYAPGNRVILYGSFLSGLAISTSNLNLALCSDQPPKNSFLLFVQKLLAKDLKEYKVMPFEEDSNAKKSIIYFYQTHNNCVAGEIVYFTNSLKHDLKLNHLLRAVLEYDERIKTLIIASRIWAEVCLIHEPENGKLHPICFPFLVIHFLQQIKPPVLPVIDVSSKDWGLKPLPERNCSVVGKLWIEFLKYYSSSFSWSENVVTVDTEDVLTKKLLSWQYSYIAIKNPCSGKNIAETVVAIDSAEYIFSSFRVYYNYFLSPVNDSDSRSEGSWNDEPVSKKWNYSFNNCNFQVALPKICESCDDLGTESCHKCNPPLVETLEKMHPLNPVSSKLVENVLLEVYNEFILSERNIQGRQMFVNDLEGFFRKIYPDVKLHLFGSSVNNFGFIKSDLDVCLSFSKKEKKHVPESQVLRTITQALRRNKLYTGVYGLYSAQIPIAKFHYQAQKWNCDLSFYNVLPVHNSRLLSKYALFDERCRILGCALKHLTKKSRIAGSDLRSLSSYSFILMMIHYLQQIEPPVLPVFPLHCEEMFDQRINIPESVREKNYWFDETVDQLRERYKIYQKNESSLTELWIGFFEFYLKYDNTFAVTIKQKEPLPSSTLLKQARLFNIEDPFLYRKNLGCILSEGKAQQIKTVFHRARFLFGRNVSEDKISDAKHHYFSSSNLTGQFIKEMECSACGAYDHQEESCLKVNPFQKYNIRKNGFHQVYRTKHTHIKRNYNRHK